MQISEHTSPSIFLVESLWQFAIRQIALKQFSTSNQNSKALREAQSKVAKYPKHRNKEKNYEVDFKLNLCKLEDYFTCMLQQKFRFFSNHKEATSKKRWNIPSAGESRFFVDQLGVLRLVASPPVIMLEKIIQISFATKFKFIFFSPRFSLLWWNAQVEGFSHFTLIFWFIFLFFFLPFFPDSTLPTIIGVMAANLKFIRLFNSILWRKCSLFSEMNRIFSSFFLHKIGFGKFN